METRFHVDSDKTNRWNTRDRRPHYVTVLDVKDNQVRLGISAPKEAAVHREEKFERINQERLNVP